MSIYSNNSYRSSANTSTGSYVSGDDKFQAAYRSDDYKQGENHQLNNDKMTIEMLIDFIQADLTFSGLMPKVLPDLELLRIIKDKAMQWFYKNYQFAVIKSYYRLDRSVIDTDNYTSYGYVVLPEECENVVKIHNISDPSLFRIGIQSPNLSINFGVTNQPYLTSFVSNVGELGVYRQILSAFSDELNKMAKNYNKYSYNIEAHRLHLLGEVRNDLMLEVYIRIGQEELFNSQLFKDYVVGLSRVRLGEALGRLTFSMPGDFQYNASDLISQGQDLVDKTVEEVKAQSPNCSFFLMAR